jgi:hypothetical protein
MVLCMAPWKAAGAVSDAQSRTEAQRTPRVREEFERSHTMTEAIHGARLNFSVRLDKAVGVVANMRSTDHRGNDEKDVRAILPGDAWGSSTCKPLTRTTRA